MAEDLDKLNRPVERIVVDLAVHLHFIWTRAAVDRTVRVVFDDLPYGMARRYLIAGATLPAALREDLTEAVGAVIDHGLTGAGH